MSSNVQLSVKGKLLVITVDLSKDGEPSKTGKSTVIASTRGNVPVPGQEGLRLGLNVYRVNGAGGGA